MNHPYPPSENSMEEDGDVPTWGGTTVVNPVTSTAAVGVVAGGAAAIGGDQSVTTNSTSLPNTTRPPLPNKPRIEIPGDSSESFDFGAGQTQQSPGQLGSAAASTRGQPSHIGMKGAIPRAASPVLQSPVGGSIHLGDPLPLKTVIQPALATAAGGRGGGGGGVRDPRAAAAAASNALNALSQLEVRVFF